MFLGTVTGLFLYNYPDTTSWIALGGTIFIGLIKCIAIPLVFFAIISGIISAKNIKLLKGMGIKTIIFYLSTIICALIISFCLSFSFSSLFPTLDTSSFESSAVEPISIQDTILNIFPDNIINPFLSNAMLPIVIIAILISFSMLSVGKSASPLIPVVQSAKTVLGKCLDYILKLSPIGVFCLICPIIATNGIELLGQLGIFIGVLYLGYIIHTLVVFSIIVKTMGKMSPVKFFKGVFPAIMFALSSTSSIASLPISMKCCERMGIPKEIFSFTLPLGSTINMDGTSIYLVFSTIFIASCYGISLTLPMIVIMIGMIIISSIGVAGVPSSAIIALSMVLAATGLPVDGIAIVLAIDRLCDMGATTVNVIGDNAFTVVMSHSYIEKDPSNNQLEVKTTHL